VYPGLQTARIPMVDAADGQEINWAIEHVPSLRHTPRPVPSEPKAPLYEIAPAAPGGEPCERETCDVAGSPSGCSTKARHSGR
jgi:hypothetical protein